MSAALSGYQIGQAIYTGTRTIVYRGKRESDSRSVVIKFLRNEYPNFSELLQFRNQYTIAKNLNIPGIICPESLESCGNSYALVMADDGGISLREYTQTHNLELTEILAIALQLTCILHDLHQNRVIHKDIKPANILIHPETKEVKLIDFSIASLLPKETQEIANPNGLEGTLAYLAPEQTGRMNRGIDYRSDFYALGVTLFELLSGKLPFESKDPMELVHCHIAKMPPVLGNREQGIGNGEEIPSVLSDIVLKLMAKNAENRYQSALGLKYDLEICLHQLKETGKIKTFEIAARDISDRFNIPERLYGRETEVQTLLDAFERVAGGGTELMLVAGFSGIGKTAVVNEVHKPITRQKGYFIKGKFDQFNRNIPFWAFVQSFRDLMGQLLSESDTQLAVWKAKILAAVGDSGQVIIDVIPELERIIGQQQPVPELSGSAAQNRFNLIFEKFISVFATKEHPLVMFLDDLQWADSASLNLLQLLMSEAGSGYLLILGAYRDNEVFPAHPLMMALEQIKKTQFTVNTITLEPLAEKTVNRLVADTLSCAGKLAEPLTQLVYQKTKGNPFFTTQFLKALHGDGWIEFHKELGYWQCDISAVRQLSLTDDVVEFMALQLQKLPPETQEILKFAACIGNQFDLNALAIVSEKSPLETATNLWKALQVGSIVPISETYKFFQSNDAGECDRAGEIAVPYKFLHDRVQQAAYSLIPEDRKQATHLQIGRLLLENTAPAERDEKIFEIVNQLNAGREQISEQIERDEVAQLNSIAGNKAKASTAYHAAVKYFTVGIELLGADSWTRQYDLMLNLQLKAAEAEYLNYDFDRAQILADVALERAQTLLEQVRVYEVKIHAYTAQMQLQAALDTGFKVLEMLGIELETEKPEIESIPDLINLPEMTDPQQLAALRVLTVMGRTAYIANPPLSQQILFTAVSLCMKYGNAPIATHVYGFCGMIFCGAREEFEVGYQFARLSLQLADKFNDRETKPMVLGMFNGFVRHWKEHLKKSIDPLRSAYYGGVESGDLVFSGYSILNYCNHLFFAGEPLNATEQQHQQYVDLLQKQKLEYHITYNRVWQQAILNLLGLAADRVTLTGTAFDETEILPILREQNNGTTLCTAYVAKTLLAYLFEESELALANAQEAAKYKLASSGLLITAEHTFYYSLALLACYPKAAPEEQKNYWQQVAENQAKLQILVDNAPMNFLHKWQLVEAEKHRILGNKFEALELYDIAISGAKSNEYIQETGLANELAAKFYLDWGKENIASGHMQEAYYCYAKWGAKAKTDDLEKRYPNLLKPILQTAVPSINPLETLASLGSSQISISSSTSTSRSSSSSINTVLDFVAILKASQSLSSTIELDELLCQLTQIILQNSGGEFCALIIPDRDGSWQVRAIAKPDRSELCEEFLENNPQVPVKLIQYVKNTQEVVVIDSLQTDLPVIGDYLQQQQPQSVLCLPILDRGQLRGILYLENRLASGVFAPDRILILNFLCTQAAISLENARLYRQAQDYAQQLEQSQLQIIQSEKMASLGNLVAGVAHEINNPLGFLNGSINNGKEHVQDLLEHLSLYQQEYPDPVASIADNAEDIDLEFVCEDLPKLLDSMKGATDRIKSISTSLRTFSRADTEHQVSANLHEGIDSTILILKYRLKANENRPAIQVIQDYGELPPVKCFPGQLNQVFMNILANAIDAFDEANAGRSFAEIEANPNQIAIRTRVENNCVTIAIADNGKGMSESVKSRIFDHLFTTKGVAKGTGLGLAIARQIVVEKHGGKIEVDSVLGQGTKFEIVLPVAP
ncbi:MAG: trifunctional serine/threonine-protein kinase/ATP-binding protein/sensor histidine kinase [Oscillatoriaceae cyanobacterium Prado104]|jgi:predicted ATPase/signal transduction histidine kinase|nr:trifunctional serine/threonine-protein kinase/ATP-binding protein/sensor histidine kinase [Oscillatoriaceae cyanobacterium Prado104]